MLSQPQCVISFVLWQCNARYQLYIGTLVGCKGGMEIWNKGLLSCDTMQYCGTIPMFQSTLLLPSSPWRWRQYRPLKHWYPTTTLHSITTQKTSTWNITAVKASKLVRTWWQSENPGHQVLTSHFSYHTHVHTHTWECPLFYCLVPYLSCHVMFTWKREKDHLDSWQVHHNKSNIMTVNAYILLFQLPWIRPVSLLQFRINFWNNKSFHTSGTFFRQGTAPSQAFYLQETTAVSEWSTTWPHYLHLPFFIS
jgi:hypothetical protein